VVTTLALEDGSEGFDPSHLGEAKEVYEEAIGDNDYFFFKGFKNERAASIIVRGANEVMCDEIERSIHDSLCVVKRTLESGSVVAGGGSVEMALNVHLEDFSRQLETREQIAVAEFAEALTIIPKVLATNAAQDANDLVSKLRVLHAKAQSGETDEKGYRFSGLDLVKGEVRHNLKHGVIEPTVSKVKSIKYHNLLNL
jgi:T-complex protein 1 subunit alpha